MRLVAGFALLSLITGCAMGSAKIWSQDTTGGVLALDGDEGKAMADADKKMAAHCGVGNYLVVRRDTVVVGEEQYSNNSYAEQQDHQAQTTTAEASQSQYGYGESATAVEGTTTVVTPNQATTVSGAATSVEGGGYQESAAVKQTDQQGQTVVQGGSSTVQGTRQVTQARITYQCRAGQPQAQPAAAPAP